MYVRWSVRTGGGGLCGCDDDLTGVNSVAEVTSPPTSLADGTGPAGLRPGLPMHDDILP